MIELKEGLILINKKGTWSQESFYISRIISLVTLSRYTHTATLCKENNKWYIYQSTFKSGVHKVKLYYPWLCNEINNNKIDVFEDPQFNKKEFLNKFNLVKNYKYWSFGLFHIGFFHIFGKKTFHKKVYKKYFCSQLTSYLHDFKPEYHLNSPATLGHSNRFKRII